MKYIRTKDGVYKIYDTHNGATNHWGYKVNEHLTLLLDEEDIKNGKSADTIEELCDEYVYQHPTKPMIIRLPKKLTQEHLEDIKKGMIIYGAIWTDKGLIYVAKMNDKGELELL